MTVLRGLSERGSVSPKGCAWQKVEIFHNQRRTFKWMELELHSYSLVLFTFSFPSALTNTLFSTFLPVPAPLGSIPELPARSCREITSSEGKDTPSNNYWLDPSGNGKAVLVYCDMNLEGKSHLTRCSFHFVFELSLFLVASLVTLRCKKSHQSWKQCIAQFQLYIKKKKNTQEGKNTSK